MSVEAWAPIVQRSRMSTSQLPLSTITEWAASQDLREAVIIGRDAQGRLRVASTSGTLEGILSLTTAAEAWATAPSPALAHSPPFRVSGDLLD